MELSLYIKKDSSPSATAAPVNTDELNFELSKAYYWIGKYKNAEEMLRLVNIDKAQAYKQMEVNILKAEVSYKIGDYKRAVESYGEAVKLTKETQSFRVFLLVKRLLIINWLSRKTHLSS
jgi:tetratricopeptide (TPR) repeat protein